MKTNEDLRKEFGKLREEEVAGLLEIQRTIEAMIEEEEISERVLRDLENMEENLRTIRNKYFWKMIRAYKRGVSLDI